MTKKLALLIFFTLLLVSSVAALEITPTRKIYSFEPGKEMQGSFTVMKSENQPMTLAISTRGELAGYIKLKDFVVNLNTGDSQKEFSYTLALPQSLSPGAHEGEIVVVGANPQKSSGDAYIGTSITLVTKIRVNVPYPGKYAESGLSITSGKVGENAVFVMPVSNLGSEDISSAVGTVQVLGPTNSLITAVKSQELKIPSGQTQELIAQWLANGNPGIYSARASVDYDGKTATANKTFSIGNMYIDILGADVKNFKLGGIAKISLTLKSEWNQDIPDVYAELFIFDDQGELNQVYGSKSTYIRLQPLATDVLPVYWDTQGLSSGTYTAKVVLHYADKTTEKSFTFHVGQDSFDAQLLSGKATEQKAGSLSGSSLSILSFVFLAIIILIGINVALFLYLKRTLGSLKKQ